MAAGRSSGSFRIHARTPSTSERSERRARTPLFGREADVARIVALVTEHAARVVTVLGPPGIGKTSLARHCLDVLDGMSGRFCDLVEVTTAEGVERALRSLHGAGDADDLVDVLAAQGPSMVVLDNFEQLVAPARFVVESLSQQVPELVVLVTSRERLGVSGEHVVELEPLACPPAGASDDVIAASPAVRLFVERARAAAGTLAATPDELASLVRRLDGIPLALELAAARTRVVAPGEWLERLGGELGLASAIDASWTLLTEEERDALAAASVFAGDFGLAAAERVLGGIDVLAALRDKSLVHATSDGRLALYASIRDYAAARLAERDEATARRRHALAYAAAARAFAELRTYQGGPDADERLRLARDAANLLAALAFVKSAPDLAEAHAEIALGVTLLQAASAETCIEALTSALERLPSDSIVLSARILLQRHNLFSAVGRFAESRDDVARLLAIEGLPASFSTLALIERAIQLRYQGAPREAWDAHLAASRRIDASTPPRVQAMNLACMGRLAHDLGMFDDARRYDEDARAIASEIGDAWIEGLPMANLAQLAQELGDLDRAKKLLDEAIARFDRTHERHYVAVYSIVYGDLLFEQGDVDAARERYAAAAGFFRGWLAHRQAVMLYGAWAALEARYGALDEAEAHLARARRSAARGPSPIVEAVLEAHGASLAVVRGEIDAARAVHARLLASDLAATSFDVRFALRMLARALTPASRPTPRLELAIARDGRWFARGDEARVDLGRRASLRAILAALAAAHAAAAPSVSRDDLLAHGWPGERLLVDAASKRLRVAIATLRSLGLREAIVTAPGGYALDPRVAVRVAEL